MSFSKGLFLSCAFLISACISAENTTSYRDVSTDEFLKNEYVSSESIELPVSGWKIKSGNDIKYTSQACDDSKWKNVKINESLFNQGFKMGGFCWYRLHFSIPEGVASKDLLLDMGYISSCDETYVNGTLVGTYGSVPPARPVNGSSWTERKYYIPATSKILKAGENLIAVKVYIGYLGGMYKGIPKISVIKNTFFRNFKLKGTDENSLSIFLTDAAHLNNYTPGAYISAAPEYAYISSEKPSVKAELEVKLRSKTGDIIQETKLPCELKSLKWLTFSPIKINASTPGKYSCEFILKSEEGTIFENKMPFSISSGKIFSIPVNENISWNDEKSQKIDSSFGHFGPRFVKDGELKDTPGTHDARGALTFSVLCSEKEEVPLVFMNNVRPSHKNLEKPKYFLALPGSEYDTFMDAWLMGCISIGKAKKKSLEVTSSSWAGKEWKYKFDDGRTLDFSINTLSPAWRLNTDSNSVNIFSGIKNYGAGLPSHIAFMTNDNKIKVVKTGESFSGGEMSANWLMVWFNGSEGWGEFDIPWLFTLQKKPESVSIGTDGLDINFGGPVGYVSGMPLFGVKLIHPSETASWKNALPEKIVARCSLWSRILANAPQNVARSFSIDYPSDTMTLKDKFTYFPISDDWNTKPLQIAPLSPALVLSATSGNIPIMVNKKNTDLSLATLHGPYLAITDTDEYLVSIGKLVHFASEVRDVTPASGEKTEQLKNELVKIFTEQLKYMNTHPWDELFWFGKYVPGNVENPAMSNVIQAAPYLPEDIRKKVFQSVKTEVEDYYLREGKPDAVINAKLVKEAKDRDLTFTLKSLSGKEMTSFTPRQDSAAIDSLCVESFRLYTVWQYAYTFNRYDFIKNNWEKLNRFYNLIPNSHDWATCVSWDTFSGVRVGNGLQESGLMHAGTSAMARMAYYMKDLKLRDNAVYFSVMQLVGMQAALSANTYLRQERPWPSSHTESDEMEFVEKTRPIHYVEFNEFGGFSQNIIFGYTFVNHTGSFVLTPLPEVMRPYKEVWMAESDDFFDPLYNPNVNISADMYVYMTNKYPVPFEKVLDARLKLSIIWYKKVNDIRAAIDHYGKISYKKLWTE